MSEASTPLTWTEAARNAWDSPGGFSLEGDDELATLTLRGWFYLPADDAGPVTVQVERRESWSSEPVLALLVATRQGKEGKATRYTYELAGIIPGATGITVTVLAGAPPSAVAAGKLAPLLLNQPIELGDDAVAPQLAEALNTTFVPAHATPDCAKFGVDELGVLLQHVWSRLTAGPAAAWLGKHGKESTWRLNTGDDAQHAEEQWARAIAEVLTFTPYGGPGNASVCFGTNPPVAKKGEAAPVKSDRVAYGGFDGLMFGKLFDDTDRAVPQSFACQQLCTLAFYARGYGFEFVHREDGLIEAAGLIGASIAEAKSAFLGLREAGPTSKAWHKEGATITADKIVGELKGGPGSIGIVTGTDDLHVAFITRFKLPSGEQAATGSGPRALLQFLDTGGMHTGTNDVRANREFGWATTVTQTIDVGSVTKPVDLAAVARLREARPLSLVRLGVVDLETKELYYLSPVLDTYWGKQNFPISSFVWALRELPFKRKVRVLCTVYVPKDPLAKAMLEVDSRAKKISQRSQHLPRPAIPNSKMELAPEPGQHWLDQWLVPVVQLASGKDGFTKKVAQKGKKGGKQDVWLFAGSDESLHNAIAAMVRVDWQGQNGPERAWGSLAPQLALLSGRPGLDYFDAGWSSVPKRSTARIRLLDQGLQPVSGATPCRLTVGGETVFEGSSDEHGVVEFVHVAGGAQARVLLSRGTGPDRWSAPQDLVLDPDSGTEEWQAKAKLHNLGFPSLAEGKGAYPDAVRAFQDKVGVDAGKGLGPKGALPPATRQKLWSFFAPPPESAQAEFDAAPGGAQPLQDKPKAPSDTPAAPPQPAETDAQKKARLEKTFTCWVIDTLPDAAAHGHAGWQDTPDISMKDRILDELNPWMEKAVAYLSWNVAKPIVRWETALPADVADHALVVYLCSHGNSRHDKKVLQKARAAKPPSNGGTVWRGADGMLCEVWPGTAPEKAGPAQLGQQLAKVIFHEWMHFKIDAHPNDQLPDDKNVHSGAFGQVGLPAVNSKTLVEPDALEALGTRLEKPYKPYRR
jgi:hypothetical protein